MRSAFSPTATSSLSPYLGFLEGFCVVGNAACRVFFSPFRPPLYAALCFVGECGKTDEVCDSSGWWRSKRVSAACMRWDCSPSILGNRNHCDSDSLDICNLLYQYLVSCSADLFQPRLLSLILSNCARRNSSGCAPAPAGREAEARVRRCCPWQGFHQVPPRSILIFLSEPVVYVMFLQLVHRLIECLWASSYSVAYNVTCV